MLDLNLAFRRITSNLALNLIVFISMAVAVLVISSSPIYLDSIDRQSLRSELKDYLSNHSEVELNINVDYPFMPINNQDIAKIDSFVRDSLQSLFKISTADIQRQIKTDLFEFDIPEQSSSSQLNRMIRPTNQGYFLNVSEFDDHVIYTKGSGFSGSQNRSYIPVAVEAGSAQEFDLNVGSIITAFPAFGANTRSHLSQSRRMFNTGHTDNTVTVKVVGIFESRDVNDPFWRGDIDKYMSPYPPIETGSGLFRDGIGIRSQDVRPYLVLMVDHNVLTGQLGAKYNGTVGESRWNMLVPPEVARNGSRRFISESLSELSSEIVSRLSGSSVRSSLNLILNESKRQHLSMYTPLLILSSVMVLGIYIFIFVVSIYVVRNRSQDSVLMWRRGFSVKGPLSYYFAEGLVFFMISVGVFPFLAFPFVSLLGLIPPFNSVTGNELLPVQLFPDPFIYAAVSGILNLVVYVSAGLIAWNSQIKLKDYDGIRVQRKPFFQRYYLDYALLICSLILIWELRINSTVLDRNKLGEEGINEFLMISPFIFLLSVSLVFFRLFPQVLRFLSGESKTLLYVVGYIFALAMGFTSIVNVYIESDTRWLFITLSVGVLIVSLVVFRLSQSLKTDIVAVLISISSALIPFIYGPDDMELFSYEVSRGFFVVPIMMFVFLIVQIGYSKSPLWFYLVFRNFARDSGRYIWVILLLAITSGILVFATTLSMTITRSNLEKALYKIGSDGRITLSNDQFYRSNYSLKNHQDKLIGNTRVATVTRIMRTDSKAGSTKLGHKFEFMAFDPTINNSWSRPDFSEQPMESILNKLNPFSADHQLVIPVTATHIGVNLKFDNNYPNITTKIGLIDNKGKTFNLSLGRINSTDWTKAIVELPDDVSGPLKLLSIYISEPGFGPSGTSGGMEISDLFYVIDQAELTVEEFNEFGRWAIIPSSVLSSDNMSILKNGGVKFNFGKHMNSSVRGIYWSEIGEFIPVIASNDFLRQTGLSIGDYSVIEIDNSIVIVKIVDRINFFATITTIENSFLLADLDTTMFHLNLVKVNSADLVNELLFTLKSDYSVADNARSGLSLRGSELLLLSEEIADLKGDVFLSVGLNILIYSIILITIFLACMGYLIHIVCNYRAYQRYFASLRMVGISKTQLYSSLITENLFLVFLGFIIGFWTGIEMCSHMVSSVVLPSDGKMVIPSPIVSVDWMVIGASFSFFIVVFAIIVLITAWKYSISNLGILSRTE